MLISIDFATPEWLVAGALATAAVGALMLLSARSRDRALRAFAGATATSSLSTRRRALRHVLVLVGIAMTCIALARPRAGYAWQETPRQGLDLMFAVDTSKSMRAADLHP